MIDVTQYVVLAVLAQNLFCLVACQAICAFIPVKKPPLAVHEIHAIVDVVKQFLIEPGVGRNNRLQLFRLDKDLPKLP
jgi:hypothetical protein